MVCKYSLKRKMAALYFFFLSTSALAEPKHALEFFDAVCISTNAKFEVIEKYAILNEAKDVSKEFKKLDPSAALKNFKTYALRYKSEFFFISATQDYDTCTIVSNDVNAAEFKKILKKNYPLKQIMRDDSGPQVNNYWQIEKKSRYSGGIISVIEAKPEFSSDNHIIIAYIPESTWNKVYKSAN